MDRFVRGFVAGVSGGVLKNIWSFFAFHVLNFAHLRFADWASVIIYGRLAGTSMEVIFATMAYLVFVGILGILFAYLIPAINSKAYLFKGVIYGICLGLVFYSLPILFSTPGLTKLDLNTVISFWVGDVIWGLTLGFVLKWLDQREYIA